MKMKQENEATEFSASAGETSEAFPAAKKPKKKVGIIVGVVCAVVVAAGAGFFVWHEQPSFCGAICHDPMDPYLATYEADSGEGASDKYGNTVDGSTMLAAVHRVEADATCLSCHEPTLSQQVGEGITWVTGGFESPLEERSLSELQEARGGSYEAFCLNDACHELLSTDALAKMTSYKARNVHDSSNAPHGQIFECGDCHKAHTQSVVRCSQCHDDAEIPDGWLTWDEYRALS